MVEEKQTPYVDNMGTVSSRGDLSLRFKKIRDSVLSGNHRNECPSDRSVRHDEHGRVAVSNLGFSTHIQIVDVFVVFFPEGVKEEQDCTFASSSERPLLQSCCCYLKEKGKNSNAPFFKKNLGIILFTFLSY